MLVLSRKQNQSIVIGDNIKLQVLKISGNTVRIGVQAPTDVKILRGELAPYDVDSKGSSQSSSEDSSKDDSQNESQESGDENMLVEGLTFELEFDQDDLTSLPNPFAVAQAS